MKRDTKLILALDVDNYAEAEGFVNQLYPSIEIFKVGSQLFTVCGHKIIDFIYKKGGQVFLDLKFHDIPHTVFSATASSTGLSYESVFVSSENSNIEQRIRENIRPAVFMMTVHILGGEEMLKEAVRGAAKKADELGIKRPFIVGVTRLTSDKNSKNTPQEVLTAARLARDSGLDGVVCSALEATRIRKEFGEDFLIVTPGIRLKGSNKDDQSRITTPQEAIAAGADFLVVGRPITKAKDPVAAAKTILESIQK